MWQTPEPTLKSPRYDPLSKVIVAKNWLGRWECPLAESRGNWQTPRWPLAWWPSKKEGCRRMDIPLSRYVEHKKAPSIHQVMEDVLGGRLVFDFEKMEGVYVAERKKGRKQAKKELGNPSSSAISANKTVLPRTPFTPREVDTRIGFKTAM
ncbi:hypothetical protein NEOLEDRAFT_1245737 [Neolentinus lepideus HHB14362 ss-1]|uniref:Uncharacterized protein n=1 Tax=Neolentinus lepideus HHB14362 ss-1 TaxID=1314782 RepID=A0A165NF67_9AGAM|nr:hypothetical protein NEOLEDRAFT_1245737 [Neolentinus lepideus HHB14362 ss-1]